MNGILYFLLPKNSPINVQKHTAAFSSDGTAKPIEKSEERYSSVAL